MPPSVSFSVKAMRTIESVNDVWLLVRAAAPQTTVSSISLVAVGDFPTIAPLSLPVVMDPMCCYTNILSRTFSQTISAASAGFHSLQSVRVFRNRNKSGHF